MRKLRLRPEELSVESFPTAARKGSERGTVRANDSEEVPITPLSTWCWTDPNAESTWQPALTCPECAPMESRDSSC
jgi:Zn finger protein HypA/HybF involved in hydrogenase expression